MTNLPGLRHLGTTLPTQGSNTGGSGTLSTPEICLRSEKPKVLKIANN